MGVALFFLAATWLNEGRCPGGRSSVSENKVIVANSLKISGRFRGPSGRTLFSDKGGFTFSEVPFEGTLHEGLKGASPSSKGFKGASPSEERT